MAAQPEPKQAKPLVANGAKIIYIIIAIGAGSAVASAYVLTPDQMAVVTADMHALFSGMVKQLGQLIGLE